MALNKYVEVMGQAMQCRIWMHLYTFVNLSRINISKGFLSFKSLTMSKVPGDNKPEYFVVPSGVFTLEECKVRVKKPAQE